MMGIKSKVHIISLESHDEKSIYKHLDQELSPIINQPEKDKYKTLFVFGDGFGENNLTLINGLNYLVKKYPIKVIGGLAGRDKIKASHYCIFTPQKIIQNGTVLIFTQLESGIGVQHGWEPLMESALEITKTNGCFVEEINTVPALDFYMHIITSVDKKNRPDKRNRYQKRRSVPQPGSRQIP